MKRTFSFLFFSLMFLYARTIETPAPLREALEETALSVIRALVSETAREENVAMEKILQKNASRKGMFASIFDKKSRKLRGCMGSLVPQRANLLEEVMHWSAMAMFHDPRGDGTQKRQREYAVIISFINGIEPVADPFEVNSITHGLMVRAAGREELVLPGEAFTTAYALKIISGKLGFDARRPDAQYFRVYAERFGKGIQLFKKFDRGYGG